MDSSFLSGANAVFISEMHKAWLDNPRGVDSEWAQLLGERTTETNKDIETLMMPYVHQGKLIDYRPR